MTIVILCGGKGSRYQNVFSDKPKALAPIGDFPILWHLLKYFDHFGFQDFILATGHRGNEIARYVRELEHPKWKINCLDTGIDSPKAERIRQVRDHIKTEQFLTTYVDGLSDVDLTELIAFHKSHGKTATVTAVRLKSHYGMIETDDGRVVRKFTEKPLMPNYINGGYMVFNRNIFDYLDADGELEEITFNALVREEELMAFKHDGFWKCMDTYKDNVELNTMWFNGGAKWAVWQ